MSFNPRQTPKQRSALGEANPSHEKPVTPLDHYDRARDESKDLDELWKAVPIYFIGGLCGLVFLLGGQAMTWQELLALVAYLLLPPFLYYRRRRAAQRLSEARQELEKRLHE